MTGIKRIGKILIANRGEIAVRIIRTARQEGIATVAVYSNVDGPESLHAQMADTAVILPGSGLKDTYLNINALITAAQSTSADAIHPGYGFLSENPAFARACEENGIIFIGPSSEVIRLMGNKAEAKAQVRNMNLPVLDGYFGTQEQLAGLKDKLDYPLLVKPAAGGGGKGMRIIHGKHDFDHMIESSAREAENYFGEPALYIERYIENARHIEIQIIADHYGSVIHLFERECSIQRRYQKIIEESPSLSITCQTRKKMAGAAVEIARRIGYTNAGTIEFLVDEKDHYYFLEMNTRIQVEHPVTEVITGIDIVKQQIHVASGLPLLIKQDEVVQKGHAIEARIYAEDPLNNFIPAPGYINYFSSPDQEHIRMDTALTGPVNINPEYDPMIGKLISFGKDRKEARNRLLAALNSLHIHGITTNLPFLSAVLTDRAYIDNHLSTVYCQLEQERLAEVMSRQRQRLPGGVIAAAYLVLLGKWNEDPAMKGYGIWRDLGYWRHVTRSPFLLDHKQHEGVIYRNDGRMIWFNFQGRDLTMEYKLIINQISILYKDNYYVVHYSWIGTNELTISFNTHQYHLERLDLLPEDEPVNSLTGKHENINGLIVSPMHGKIIKIAVEENQMVTRGETLFVIDSMKIENNVTAPRNARIDKIMVNAGEQIKMNAPVMLIN